MITRHHYQVYFEENFREDLKAFLNSINAVSYSHHAKLQTIQDRYGIIPVIKKDSLPSGTPIEYYRIDGILWKVVFKFTNFNSAFDYSYTIAKDGTVVTAWANEKSDNHSTLNHTIYEQEGVLV